MVDPLQAKILEWLRSRDEDRAVDWFLSGWTGDNKRWMLANLGYGMVSSNNGQESSHRHSSDAASGSNGNVKLRHFLSNTTKHMADLSERLQADAVRMKIPVYSLQEEPRLTNRHWDILQLLDDRTLLVSVYPATMNSKKLMDVLREIQSNKESSQIKSLYNSIVELDSSLRTLKASTDIKQVHIPTQQLIRSLDPTGHLSVEELRPLVHAKCQDYMRTINDGFSSEDTVEEALDKLEMFHTLTALSKPWSPAVHHKCSCESSFKDAICTHALLLALLCDSTLKIPAQYLCTGIPARRKRGRPTMQGGDVDDTAEQNEKAARVRYAGCIL